MLMKKMEAALIDQINFELYSAYLYGSMVAYFESLQLPGFSNWMRVQIQEEMFHATKLFNFVFERDGRVKLKAIGEPPFEWKSPLDAFEEAHKHECLVSKRIHAIVDLARKEKDHAVESFLQWFVTEQIEEEASTKNISQQLRFIGRDPHALFMIDRELAQRVYTPPPAQP